MSGGGGVGGGGGRAEMGRKAREIRATVVRFLLVDGGTHTTGGE
jgi:hypothetical protein